MAIPYFLGLGSGNIFLNDYYAKRIMTLISLPFFLIIIYLSLKKQNLSIRNSFVWYLILVTVVFINSILFGNSLSLIILDLFVVLLPVFFYLLVNKLNFSIKDYSDYFFTFLLIACILVIFDIKLQFSYFSMLGIVYIIFLTKFNFKTLIFSLFLPLLVVNTLIGKSSLILLVFMMLYFFFIDKSLVSYNKKIYLALIPSIIILLGVIIFWDIVRETGAYRNTYYFFNHADFSKFKFTDLSTGQRLYEASRVIQEFFHANWLKKVFGFGFGSTIDLSGTKDMAIMASNSDLTKVRHIHMGVFAVLHRFGLIGLAIYFSFIIQLIRSCFRVLKNSKDVAIVLSALYLLVIMFDSFISFPHMMSNFLFWLITFIIFHKSESLYANPKVI